MIATELEHRFGIPGIARVTTGHGDLTRVVVTAPAAGGEIYLHGGQVTSWTPTGGLGDLLFVSRAALWQPGRAIRGGVPVCFPWFGANAKDAQAPAHGLVRLREWQLESIERRGNGVAVTAETSSDASTRALWPFDFHLSLRVTFAEALHLELTATNRGPTSFTFEEALHTYFAVGDIGRVRVGGLDGLRFLNTVGGIREELQSGDIRFAAETDRIYLDTLHTVAITDLSRNRRTTVAKTNSRSTVIWNPWIDRARLFADFGDDEWMRMVCVETCNVRTDAISLSPGERHTMTATIQCLSLTS